MFDRTHTGIYRKVFEIIGNTHGKVKNLKVKHKKGKIIIVIILAFIIACVIACVYFVNDYYKSTDEVDSYFNKQGTVTIKKIDDGMFIDGPGTEIALIFYPGAKVEYTAYIPMLYQLAENNVDVFLIKMPCNLAIFGFNKADNIFAEYQYEHWYLGGHSLGGAMAANYASKRLEDGKIELNGLVLMAAYPTKSLEEYNLKVLTIYGSNDEVLNMDKIERARKLLPENAKETVIEGGNHAQFGCYGTQEGDGTATISKEKQWTQTVQAILELINS